ncbi:MAG: rRNA maturation RNase YbeY [Acidobacteria bacterium]|nr:MAG: rRNA maturation RNase YbeY [Acidobacteriota bacterium]
MTESEKSIVCDVISRKGLDENLSEEKLTEFLNDLSAKLELPGRCRMEILFTGNDEIQDLNRGYRDKDCPTDVLSFMDGDKLPDTDEIFLGSVVISVERARAQSSEIGHSLEDELKFLVLHGFLHLLGYDHEGDDGEMLGLQRELKKAFPNHFGGKI